MRRFPQNRREHMSPSARIPWVIDLFLCFLLISNQTSGLFVETASFLGTKLGTFGQSHIPASHSGGFPGSRGTESPHVGSPKIPSSNPEGISAGCSVFSHFELRLLFFTPLAFLFSLPHLQISISRRLLHSLWGYLGWIEALTPLLSLGVGLIVKSKWSLLVWNTKKLKMWHHQRYFKANQLEPGFLSLYTHMNILHFKCMWF